MGLKIAFVSPYGWKRPSGVQEHIRHLATQLILMGNEVSILAPALKLDGTLQGVQTYNLGWTLPFPINGTVVDIPASPAAIRYMHALFQREAFDIIHIHEPLLPGLPLAALRATNALTVGTFHAYPLEGAFSIPSLAYTAMAPLLHSSFQRLDGRIAVSDPARQFISRSFPADYQVIPNGVDLHRFNAEVVPLPALMDGKRNILFVGRFDSRKGAKYLLHAIPAIRSKFPNTRFLFVGEGSQRRKLQEIALQQGWRDVMFPGYVPSELLPRYFASAHIFCTPATGGESMGIVLLEAMASGIPIVATNIPGYAALIKPSVDGLLVPPRNSQELAKAIIELTDNETLCRHLVMTGTRKIRNYAWPLVAWQVMNYYNLLLQKTQFLHAEKQLQ